MTIYSQFKGALLGVLQVLRNLKNDIRAKKIRSDVAQVLASAGEPNTKASQEDFYLLSLKYRGPGEYGYDRKATWLRGMQRAQQIASIVPGFNSAQRSLEVACGDGMVSLQLAILGVDATLTDLRDWRDERAMHLPFQACDLCTDSRLPGADYDLVFSYNAFEHFPDPASALQRMISVAKPGAYLLFEFGPLYAGPWGLHAYRMLPMPYPQFLFDETFWRKNILATGVRDLGQDLDDLQPLNRWTASKFDKLWLESNCEVVLSRKYITEEHIDLVLQYPEAFRGRGLTFEDLTTQGLLVLLRKPEVVPES